MQEEQTQKQEAQPVKKRKGLLKVLLVVKDIAIIAWEFIKLIKKK